ncbi:hypothetical protein [Romboutsia sp.]|uniref:hypothetical protein n=1 Tax=Romboutsia sp. TaxID=1965302 RepID=UPI002CB57078|nr:hypothetical protein [Romboutsia sp.]HSQ88915.1 hypothetical protein [Romboutsia sp.]HSQ90311.1 hypothetical protein [Romboutsia sp.]
MNREELIKQYEKGLNRLEKAEKWLHDNNIDWEYVEANKPKIWHERVTLLAEIEWLKEEMLKREIIKGNIEGFEIVKAT